MPLQWIIKPEVRLVTVRADGNVERAEFENLVDELTASSALSYRKLFDGVGGTTSMSPDDILALGVRFRGLQEKHALGPLAVAVPGDKFEVVARVLGMLATARRLLRVFDDVGAASRWLATQRDALHLPTNTAAERGA